MVVWRDSPAAEGGRRRRDRIRIVSVLDEVADIALDSDVAVDRGSRRRNVLTLRLGDIDIFRSSFVCGGRVYTVVVVAVVTVVVVFVLV